MSEREKLLNMLRAYSFAAYEWNLYLDTHPNDKQGIAMHRKMADQGIPTQIRTSNGLGSYQSKLLGLDRRAVAVGLSG